MKHWKDCIVAPNRPIREVISVLDAAALQIALVVEDGVLRGTVTDGDIRRALLKGVDFAGPIELIAHASPTTVRQNTSREEIAELMRTTRVRAVPVLDLHDKVVGIELIEQVLGQPHAENEVVIMAGGLGMRLKPLTDATPKPMLPIGGQPILATIIDRFASHGFRRFHLAVNYERQQIKDYFGDGSSRGVTIGYLEEDTKLGTAGALSLLPVKPTAPLFVMNGDILTRVNFLHLMNFHRDSRAKATMAVREFSIQVPYGVVDSDENHRVERIVEKPVHRVFVNAGIYVLDPEAVAEIEPGVALDMPTLLERLLPRGVQSFPVHEYWIDIGRADDFERAKSEYGETFR